MTRVLFPALGLALVAAATGPALSAVSAASTSTTRTIAGTPVGPPVDQAVVRYDDGTSIHDPYIGPESDVSLTATARGGVIDVVITLGAGPVQPYENRAAGSYRVDAYVRVDGAANTRGKHRLVGPIGSTAVTAYDQLFPDGLEITGTIAGVSPGRHTLTLSDLLVDVSDSSSGGFGGTPTGDDAYYNAGSTYGTIVTRPTDWPVAAGVTVGTDTAGPALSITAPKKKPSKAKSWKKVKGTATDASGTKSVTVRLSQRRSDGSYIYTGTKWKKGKAGKAKAVAAKVSGSGTTSTWSVSIKKPGKGTMTIKYSGTDTVGNTSAVKKYKTKRLK